MQNLHQGVLDNEDSQTEERTHHTERETHLIILLAKQNQV